MKLVTKLLFQAPVIFVLGTAIVLWATGYLHLGLPEEGHPETGVAAASDPHAEHGHAPGEPHEDEAEAAPPGCTNPDHDHEKDWCAEHGVPESACIRCEPSLAAAFKARGDWCAEHGLPESQCVACGGGGCAVPRNGATGSLASIEGRRCEHGIPILDCDDCRFEVGVVKVEGAVAEALLRVARVEVQPASRTLRLTGQVHFDRSRLVEVPSPAGGRVVEVAVDLGQLVETGTLLAVLHSGDVATARASYLEALTLSEIAEKERERQAEMTAALEALLARLPAEIDRPLSGEEAEIETAVPSGLVGEWKSRLVGAAASLRIARARHDRELELEQKGISAKAEHEEAHREYEAAKAEYASLIEEAKLSIHLDKLKSDSAAKQACATVEAGKEGLRVLGLDDGDIERLAAGQDGGNLARLEIRAPRTGTITALDLSVGHVVEINEKLLTIADLEHVWVWCDLYERDLAAVMGPAGRKAGVPARIRVASYPGVTFEGVLDLLGSEVDEHTRTVKARIQVPNVDRKLRPGMFADVELRIRGEEGVLVVPRNAVLSDEGASFVFQRWRDGLWVRRDVVVKETVGDVVVIEGEIPEGAEVAAGGAFMLKGDVLREKMGAG